MGRVVLMPLLHETENWAMWPREALAKASIARVPKGALASGTVYHTIRDPKGLLKFRKQALPQLAVSKIQGDTAW